VERQDGGIGVLSIAVLVGVLVAGAVAAGLVLRTRPPGRTAPVLRVVAAASTVLVAALVVGPAWRDSGAFTGLLVGVPLVCAVAALLAGRAVRGGAVMWTAAVLMLSWSLLTALGVGVWFLGPSALMLAAAVATRGRRARPGSWSGSSVGG
jgi:hypothetical protein